MAVTSTYQLKTFDDIVKYVANELKVQLSSAEDVNRIKRAINATYIDRVVSQTTEWPWVRKSVDLPFRARITTACTVTQNSPTVILQTGPTESVARYLFSAQGLNQRLLIKSHVPGSTTVILDSPWTAASSASSLSSTSYIWSEKVILPTDCREVLSVIRQNWPVPLESVSTSEYDELVSVSPANAYDPTQYTVFDVIDPAPFVAVSGMPPVATSSSSGVIRTLNFTLTGPDVLGNYVQQGQRISVSGSSNYRFNIDAIISSVSSTSLTYTGRERFTQTATADVATSVLVAGTDSGDARYQALCVYPNQLPQDKTLNVKYAIEVAPLVETTDEPRITFSDRIVLAYGALSQVWDSIGRNPEMAQKNEGLFERKLSQMVARISSSNDYPQLVPDKQYLARKRRPRSLRDWYWD